MTERYSKLFSLDENLYCPGAPLIIRAARLMRDGYTGRMLAQIKYQNISAKVIKAAEICLTGIDSAGRVAFQPVIYKYTELNARRDVEFGQKTAVMVPDEDIKNFTIAVREVVFDDGSCWSWDETPWTALKKQRSLSESLEDEELATQYQIRYGSNCLYEPCDDMGLWFCTCGGVNDIDERSCHSCRRVYSALREVNVASLKSECEQRLETEKEKQEQDNADNEVKRDRFKSLALLIAPVLAILLMVAVFVPREIKRKNEYEQAQTLVENGQYDKASDAFSALGDYKDSSEKAEKNIPYEETLELMRYAETENPVGLKLLGITQSSLTEEDDISIILYEAAAERFEILGDYEDSARLSQDCLKAIENIKNEKIQAQYESAQLLLKNKEYCKAKDAFIKLARYKDSALMAREALYQKALALYGFMSQQNVKDVYASISTKTDVPGIISFSKDFALGKEEGYITEFKAACGKDDVNFVLEDSPSEGLVTFQEALVGLFESLGNYKDSKEYIPQIATSADYTHEFFELVEKGDLFAAYDWLNAYENEFEGRDQWLEWLEMYKPYCSSWALNSGDASLIPYIAGNSNNGTNTCTGFTSVVMLKDNIATLKVSSNDGLYSIEFSSEIGNSKGFSNNMPPFNYFAYISNFDRLAIIKYDSGGKSVSSCDYSRSY